MSLTVAQIVKPVRNLRLVALARIANFVLAPALAYGIAAVIPIDDALRTALIVLATAAGAPFLPKLVQVAHGPIALGDFQRRVQASVGTLPELSLVAMPRG